MAAFTQASLFDAATTAPKPAPQRRVSVKNCSIVYTPKGRAREYSALACNVYTGCGHHCTYCFGPRATFKSQQEFDAPRTRGSTFLHRLEKDAAKYRDAGITGRVLLSFTCDPYQPLDVKEQVTRETIQTLHRYGLHVQVLTKGGRRALRDLDLFTHDDAFACTLTCLDEGMSLHWEPDAATPADRIATLQAFHEAGIPTWASLEPVLDPAVALRIIRRTHEFVDLFKVGKLNYHPLDKEIDWKAFALDAISLLKSLGYVEIQADDDLQPGQKAFYVKRDLRACL